MPLGFSPTGAALKAGGSITGPAARTARQALSLALSLLGQEQVFRALADVLSKSLMLTSGL